MSQSPLTLDPSQQPWQWQLKQAVRSPEKLLALLELEDGVSEQELAARKAFPMMVPLPFVDKMAKGDRSDPLFRQVWPSAEELLPSPGYVADPLQEHEAVVPGLIHKYGNRVLLIVRGGCAINCRYCFRRHFPYQENKPGEHHWQEALSYIQQNTAINEVILSGGDPLMADDLQLSRLIRQLESIDHLKRLRIHSRLPVVIPSRLTDALLHQLQQSRLQAILVLHINHPNELDKQLRERLVDYRQAGIWLLNQSVLLAGINDTTETLVALSEALAEAGVQPYYLHLLDKVSGAAHFDIPEHRAQALAQELLESLPGFLVPKLVREIAGEKSKTPLDLELRKS